MQSQWRPSVHCSKAQKHQYRCTLWTLGHVGNITPSAELQRSNADTLTHMPQLWCFSLNSTQSRYSNMMVLIRCCFETHILYIRLVINSEFSFWFITCGFFKTAIINCIGTINKKVSLHFIYINVTDHIWFVDYDLTIYI